MRINLTDVVRLIGFAQGLIIIDTVLLKDPEEQSKPYRKLNSKLSDG